jgi:hypothetical protein
LIFKKKIVDFWLMGGSNTYPGFTAIELRNSAMLMNIIPVIVPQYDDSDGSDSGMG